MLEFTMFHRTPGRVYQRSVVNTLGGPVIDTLHAVFCAEILGGLFNVFIIKLYTIIISRQGRCTGYIYLSNHHT